MRGSAVTGTAGSAPRSRARPRRRTRLRRRQGSQAGRSGPRAVDHQSSTAARLVLPAATALDQPSPGPDPARRPRSARLASAVCAVLFLTFLDNTIVSVALADMQTSLKAGVSSLQWIVDGYMLAFAGLMLSAARSATCSAARRSCWRVVLFFAGSLVGRCASTRGR